MACSCGKVLYTCSYASTQKTEIFVFPQLIHCSDTTLSTPADFIGAPWSTKTPCGIQGRTILLCCPIPTSQTYYTHSSGSKEPLAQISHLKSSKDFFFLTSLAPSKVFLNEGELNNFSQKVFLIYYILQLDRPHPRPAGFT